MSTVAKTESGSSAPRPAEGGSGQFLTFVLAGEEYAVDILKVQEIRGWTNVTHIPNTLPYVQGVLNLRGTIVPIIDLRMRFQLPKLDYTGTTVVVVLSVAGSHGSRVIGIVVDGVSDVSNVAAGDIKPAPDFGTVIRTEFISGMATISDRMVILLDSDKLLTTDELQSLDAVPH